MLSLVFLVLFLEKFFPLLRGCISNEISLFPSGFLPVAALKRKECLPPLRFPPPAP